MTAPSTPTGVHSRPVVGSWLVTAGAVVLHNLEEWRGDLTGWISGQAWLPAHALHGNSTAFAIVLALVTAAVCVVATIAIITRPPWSASTVVVVGYVLIANAASHLVLSLLTWTLMPGVVTGVGVLAPAGCYVIVKAGGARAAATRPGQADLTRSRS